MTLEQLLKGINLDEVKSVKDIVKVVNKNAKEANTQILFDSKDQPNYIPKYRLDAEIAKRKNAEEAIETLETEIKDNSKASKDIETYKQEKENLEKELKNLQKNVKLKESISKLNYKPHDTEEILNNYLDLEKIEINESGEVKGLKEQVESLYKEKSYLFAEVEGGTKGPGVPGGKKAIKGKEDSLGDKIAKASFSSQQDIQEVQNSFFE